MNFIKKIGEKSKMTGDNLKTIMTLKSNVTILSGVSMVFIPSIFFSLFGISLDPGGIMIARLYGAALFIFGLQLYFSRNAQISRSDFPGLVVTAVGDMIAVFATWSAQIHGVMNFLGWMLIAIYVLSAGLFGYLSYLSTEAER